MYLSSNTPSTLNACVILQRIMAIAWIPLISEKFRMGLWYTQMMTIFHFYFVSSSSCMCIHIYIFYRFPTDFNHIIVELPELRQHPASNNSIHQFFYRLRQKRIRASRCPFYLHLFFYQHHIVSFSPRCVYAFQAYNFYEVTKFTFRTPNGIDPFSSKMRYRRSFFSLFRLCK